MENKHEHMRSELGDYCNLCGDPMPKDNPERRSVEEIVKSFDEVMIQAAISEMRGENPDTEKIAKDWLRTTLTAERTAQREMVEEILHMADELELECGRDGDKGTKQWMAFKGFRNAIRDKFNIEVSK